MQAEPLGGIPNPVDPPPALPQRALDVDPLDVV
jgi:hypothetical protein